MQIACSAILCLDSQLISFLSQTVAFHIISGKLQHFQKTKKLFGTKCGLISSTTFFPTKSKIQQDIIGLNVDFRKILLPFSKHLGVLASKIQQFLTVFTIGLSLARFWRAFIISEGGGGG